MKVWVVESWWCQESLVIGVFSTQEKADAFVAKQPTWYGYDYNVEAYDVDDESNGNQ